MASKLETKCESEEDLRRFLRLRACAEIKRIGIERTAGLLEIHPSSVSALLARNEWTLKESLRVGDALELGTLDAIHFAIGFFAAWTAKMKGSSDNPLDDLIAPLEERDK